METEEILVAIQQAAETIATPNWADKLSVIISFFAIVVAGFVAWRQYGITKIQNEITERQTEIAKKQSKISERQNKIALFELRYAVLNKLAFVINIGSRLLGEEEEKTIDASELLYIYKVVFGFDVINMADDHEKQIYVLSEICKAEYIIQKAPFLFPDITQDELNELFDNTTSFLLFLVENETKQINLEDDDVKRYIETSKKFRKKHWDKIKLMLDLTGDD